MRPKTIHCKQCGRPVKVKAAGVIPQFCGDWCRKRSYGRPCVDCGKQTDGSWGREKASERCRPCRRLYEGTMEARARHLRSGVRKWTDEQILDAIRAASRNGEISKPMYEAYYERHRGEIPTHATVISRFELWSDAVHAAGLRFQSARSVFGPYSTRITTEGCLLAMEDCMAEVGQIPTLTQYDAWARANGAPSKGLLRVRFGSWSQAVLALQKQMAA